VESGEYACGYHSGRRRTCVCLGWCLENFFKPFLKQNEIILTRKRPDTIWAILSKMGTNVGSPTTVNTTLSYHISRCEYGNQQLLVTLNSWPW